MLASTACFTAAPCLPSEFSCLPSVSSFLSPVTALLLEAEGEEEKAEQVLFHDADAVLRLHRFEATRIGVKHSAQFNNTSYECARAASS